MTALNSGSRTEERNLHGQNKWQILTSGTLMNQSAILKNLMDQISTVKEQLRKLMVAVI